MLALLFCGTDVLGENSDEENKVRSMADAWLVLIDSGKYDESWKKSSNFLKNAITSEDWEKAILSARKPLGKLISRKATAQKHYTTLPGAPDGSYFVIQYEAIFENKAKAIETITMMKEKDGNWYASGYYIS